MRACPQDQRDPFGPAFTQGKWLFDLAVGPPQAPRPRRVRTNEPPFPALVRLQMPLSQFLDRTTISQDIRTCVAIKVAVARKCEGFISQSALEAAAAAAAGHSSSSNTLATSDSSRSLRVSAPQEDLGFADGGLPLGLTAASIRRHNSRTNAGTQQQQQQSPPRLGLSRLILRRGVQARQQQQAKSRLFGRLFAALTPRKARPRCRWLTAASPPDSNVPLPLPWKQGSSGTAAASAGSTGRSSTPGGRDLGASEGDSVAVKDPLGLNRKGPEEGDEDDEDGSRAEEDGSGGCGSSLGDDVCCICYDRSWELEILPCRHCFCTACAKEIVTQSLQPKNILQPLLCPFCRQKVRDVGQAARPSCSSLAATLPERPVDKQLPDEQPDSGKYTISDLGLAADAIVVSQMSG